MVERPPADAGDTGSCPSPGRSHMPRSGWVREPWLLSLCVRSLCSATGEAAAMRGPRTANNKKKNPQVGASSYFYSRKIYFFPTINNKLMATKGEGGDKLGVWD